MQALLNKLAGSVQDLKHKLEFSQWRFV